jgi:hypothetical protein
MLSLPRLLLPTALAFAALAGSASAAPLDGAWTGGGTGKTSSVAGASDADPRFDYDSLGVYSGSWTFGTVAASTRSVPVAWDYSGLHAWFQVRVGLERFVARGGTDVLRETLVSAGPAVCCTTPSDGFRYTGRSTFEVRKGDVYGFRMTGSNSDYNQILRGSLKLAEVDETPPAVKPVVTGEQGANGFYTGPVGVSWTVADPDSRIVGRTGCDAVTVSADTAGDTYTCTAASRGGTTTESVTVKRDTAAPELTVPPVLVAQATSVGGAPLTYAATASDAVDPAPGVACATPSGSTFPVGTTSVSCTATDAAGHATTKRFDAVVVAPQQRVAPAAQRRMAILPALTFRYRLVRGATKFSALKIKRIPAGATVTVSCAGPSCPKPLRRHGRALRSRTSALDLTKLVRRPLKGGATLTIKVTAPDAVTGVKWLMVRAGKAPQVR